MHNLYIDRLGWAKKNTFFEYEVHLSDYCFWRPFCFLTPIGGAVTPQSGPGIIYTNSLTVKKSKMAKNQRILNIFLFRAKLS